MGIIKSICVTGAVYIQHGLGDERVLTRLLVEKYGFKATVMIEDFLKGSRRLSDKSRLRTRRKRNCWEVRKCPMMIETSDQRTSLCPAIISEGLDGVHGGLNAGRMCWAVDGTYCNGGIQGSSAQKIDECKACGFFMSVSDEEGAAFIGSIDPS